MNLYVLVATAVYDHGVVGVYATEELARDAAKEIWPQTDGHHRFRIDVCELDRTYEKAFIYFTYSGGDAWPPTSEVPIDLNTKEVPGA